MSNCREVEDNNFGLIVL